MRPDPNRDPGGWIDKTHQLHNFTVADKLVASGHIVATTCDELRSSITVGAWRNGILENAPGRQACQERAFHVRLITKLRDNLFFRLFKTIAPHNTSVREILRVTYGISHGGP